MEAQSASNSSCALGSSTRRARCGSGIAARVALHRHSCVHKLPAKDRHTSRDPCGWKPHMCIPHTKHIERVALHRHSCVHNLPATDRHTSRDPCGWKPHMCIPHTKHIENLCEWMPPMFLPSAHRIEDVPASIHPSDEPLDRSSIASHIQDCPSLPRGRHLHSLIVELGFVQDFFLSNLLIGMYHTHGLVDDACVVFHKMPYRTVVSWNTMITAYSECGNIKDSVQLLQHMLHHGIQPDQVTFICVLAGCTTLPALDAGKVVHAHVIDLGLDADVRVKNAIVNMYGKCGALEDACVVFEGMLHRNVISWTAMITAYCQHGHNRAGLHLFRLMEQHGTEPNDVTFISILGACANHEALLEGRGIHASIVENGYVSVVVVVNALVSMYGKCGSLHDACLVFDNMHHRNVDSWNAMISVYSQHGQCQKGLRLFEEMQQQNFKPNKVTFLCILGACTIPAVLGEGKAIHACTIDCGLDADVAIRSALITMYSNCGGVEEAHLLFDSAYHHDLVLWTAMITAYAQHGHGEKALQLFGQMQQEGRKPNNVTFICILSACSHAGLTDEGCFFFNSMVKDYKLTPETDHFSCMIDLLGKAGRLAEAAFMISKLLAQPNAPVWRTFLAACRMHGDVKRAEWAAEHLLDAGPRDKAIYTLLSNIYAANGRWIDVERVKEAIDKSMCKREIMVVAS